MDTLGEKVCELKGGGKTSVNTDVLTSEEENVRGGVTCVDALCVCTLYCITLSV